MAGLIAGEASADKQRSALSLFRQWIINALEAKKHGDGAMYWRLLEEIDAIRSDPVKLSVMSQCVSYFDHVAHEALLVQLLGVSLWESEDVTVGNAMLDFAVKLASANASCVSLTIDMLVRNFMPPSCGVPAFMGVPKRPALLSSPSSRSPSLSLPPEAALASAIVRARSSKSQHLSRQSQVTSQLTLALTRIAQLVPTAVSQLQALVLQRMPHRRLEKEFQCIFFANMFALAEADGCDGLADAFLCASVDHLIHMDVEIRWEDILADLQARATAAAAAAATADGGGKGDAEGRSGSSREGGGGKIGEKKVQGRWASWQGRGVGCFDAEMLEVEEEEEEGGGRVGGGVGEIRNASDGLVARAVGPPPPSSTAACDTNDEVTPGATTPSTSARPGLAVDEMADKMDGLMDLTFQHIQRRHAQGHRQQVHASLLRSFDSTILHTHRSKFTQFLLFFSCSLDPSSLCTSSFLHHLLSLALSPSPSLPSDQRVCSAAYLASFLARAAFVPPHQLSDVLGRMIDWCTAFVDSHSTPPSPSLHPTHTLTHPHPSSLHKSKSWAGLRSQAVSPRFTPLLPHPPHPSLSHSLSQSCIKGRRVQVPVRGCKRSSASLKSLTPSQASEQLHLPTLSSCSSSPLLPPADQSPTHAPLHLPLAVKAAGSLSPSSCHHEAKAVLLPQRLPSLPPSPAQLQAFYALCQAVLYILCFHMQSYHRPAQQSKHHALKLNSLFRLLTSHLQPLKMCSEGVASEFCRQAAHCRLFGKRTGDLHVQQQQQHLQQQGQQGQGQQQQLPLTLSLFFPFDPYLLRHSLRFVRPIFTSWQPPAMDEALEEDEGLEEGEGMLDVEDAGCSSDEDEGERGSRSSREGGRGCMEGDSDSEASNEGSDGLSCVDGFKVYKAAVMADIEEGEGEASSPSKRVKMQHRRKQGSWQDREEESEVEEDDDWSASVCVVLPSTPSAGRARLPAKLL